MASGLMGANGANNMLEVHLYSDVGRTRCVAALVCIMLGGWPPLIAQDHLFAFDLEIHFFYETSPTRYEEVSVVCAQMECQYKRSARRGGLRNALASRIVPQQVGGGRLLLENRLSRSVANALLARTWTAMIGTIEKSGKEYSGGKEVQVVLDGAIYSVTVMTTHNSMTYTFLDEPPENTANGATPLARIMNQARLQWLK